MYYVLDENKNLIEALSKEDVLGILEQAIEQGTLENIDEDTAVASKLRSVINGSVHHIEFVTQAEFNDLDIGGDLVAGTYYFITDDTSLEDLTTAIQGINDDLAGIESALRDGSFVVGNSQKVNNLAIQKDENGVLFIPNAKTVDYQVTIGSVLRTADDIAYYEISGDGLYHHQILTYQNEEGRINYDDSNDSYEIRVAVGGAFAAASGSTIIAEGEANIIIPQRILLANVSIEFTGTTGATQYPKTIYTSGSSLNGKTLEIEIDNQFFKFKASRYYESGMAYFYLPNRNATAFQGSPNDHVDADQYTLALYLGAGGVGDLALLGVLYTSSSGTFEKTIKIYEVIE